MSGASGRILGLALWLLLFALSSAAQEPETERVDLVVTGRTQRAAFVDRGSESGLRVEDRVTLFPTGGAPIEGIVRAVSRGHARVELAFDEPGLRVGDRGEVRVALPGPEAAPELPRDPELEPKAPSTEVRGDTEVDGDEPQPARPWRTPPEEWDRDRPLLAPAGSGASGGRPTTWHGRVYGSGRWSSTQLAGKREHAFARLGSDWTLTNGFGQAGELRFAGEVFARRSSAPGASGEGDEELRLTRLSYRLGGTREEPRRWLLGRFYPELMPEFGPLDGLSLGERLSAEDELGVSLGHMPDPGGALSATGDLAAAVFHRHRSQAGLPLDWRAGYQKTWHRGREDRDLVVLDAQLHDISRSRIGGTAWVDLYDSSDGPKGTGPELTRLQLAASQSTESGDGLRLRYSEFRFPHLLRNELDADLVADVFEDHDRRYGLDAWTQLGRDARLGLRLDRWQDEDGGDDEGLAGELRGDVTRALDGPADVGLALFGSEGEFSDLVGARLSLVGYEAGTSWGLHYEISRLDEEPAQSPAVRAWRQRVDARYGTLVFDAWSLSLDGSAGWGDEGQSLGLGLYLQRSF